MTTTIKLTQQMWENYSREFGIPADVKPGIRANYLRKRINHDWDAELIYTKDSSQPFTWNEHLVFEDDIRAVEFLLKYA